MLRRPVRRLRLRHRPERDRPMTCVPKSLTVIRGDVRVTYTPGRGVAIYRKVPRSWGLVAPRRVVPVAGER